MYLFFVHSDSASNPMVINIFILPLEACKINMYFNIFGNPVQTAGPAKRFPPEEHIRCILIVHHHHHHLHHSQWHLNCFPVQQKINKAGIWADGVCLCRWGRFGWHIFQSEGVCNAEAAALSKSSYGSNKSFSSSAIDTSYKKKKTHYKNTIDSYMGFYSQGYERLVSDPALPFIYYGCSDKWLTISSHEQGIAELTDCSAHIETSRPAFPTTAGFEIDRQAFLWAGWMKAHSLVHNNMESFSLIWHWTDDPVTAWCSTSKHSMFSVLLHFTSSYSKMWSWDCAVAQHSGFCFIRKLATGSAIAHHWVIASAPTATASAIYRVPRWAATVAPVWRIRVTATPAATPRTTASSTATERKQAPGQEAGGAAADGGTGTVVGDRPLSGTVQDKKACGKRIQTMKY